MLSKGSILPVMNKRKREVILALSNSQLAAQLESVRDFYTKKLSLIKFSDCSL